MYSELMNAMGPFLVNCIISDFSDRLIILYLSELFVKTHHETKNMQIIVNNNSVK